MFYNVTLHKKDYPQLPYKLGVQAKTNEEAIQIAKDIIVKKAYWGEDPNMTDEDKSNILIVDEVQGYELQGTID